MDREILLVAERGADDELAEEGCGRDLLLGDGLEAIAATVSPRLVCSQPPAPASLHTAHALCSLPLRPVTPAAETICIGCEIKCHIFNASAVCPSVHINRLGMQNNLYKLQEID